MTFTSFLKKHGYRSGGYDLHMTESGEVAFASATLHTADGRCIVELAPTLREAMQAAHAKARITAPVEICLVLNGGPDE